MPSIFPGTRSKMGEIHLRSDKGSALSHELGTQLSEKVHTAAAIIVLNIAHKLAPWINRSLIETLFFILISAMQHFKISNFVYYHRMQ